MKKSVILGALVVAVVLSAAVYATADSKVIPGSGSPVAASGTVNVKATVNPKLTLTIVTPVGASQTVDFGTIDPGVASAVVPVSVTVSSNKKYDLDKVVGGQAVLMGLTTDLAASAANVETASRIFTDNYAITVPWTTAPGALTATVQYTVTQK